jgi:prophage regulatory protein
METSAASQPVAVLRLPEVRRRTGQSTSTIYAAMAAGTFPRPLRLSAGTVGWLEREVADWILGRVAERDAAHIKDAGDTWQPLGQAVERVVEKIKPME